jgi:hypothetical protein
MAISPYGWNQLCHPRTPRTHVSIPFRQNPLVNERLPLRESTVGDTRVPQPIRPEKRLRCEPVGEYFTTDWLLLQTRIGSFPPVDGLPILHWDKFPDAAFSIGDRSSRFRERKRLERFAFPYTFREFAIPL